MPFTFAAIFLNYALSSLHPPAASPCWIEVGGIIFAYHEQRLWRCDRLSSSTADSSFDLDATWGWSIDPASWIDEHCTQSWDPSLCTGCSPPGSRGLRGLGAAEDLRCPLRAWGDGVAVFWGEDPGDGRNWALFDQGGCGCETTALGSEFVDRGYDVEPTGPRWGRPRWGLRARFEVRRNWRRNWRKNWGVADRDKGREYLSQKRFAAGYWSYHFALRVEY